MSKPAEPYDYIVNSVYKTKYRKNTIEYNGLFTS